MRHYQMNHVNERVIVGNTYEEKLLSSRSVISTIEKWNEKIQHDLKEIPEEFMKENFVLNKSIFKIETKDKAMVMNEDLNRYLEIVEGALVQNIS